MNYPLALAAARVVGRPARRAAQRGRPMSRAGRPVTDADLYELLGVRRDATDDELKRAYRAKAREFHPDANHDDDGSAERFKEISLAYEVLKDPERRARYDRYGAEGRVRTGRRWRGRRATRSAAGLGDLFDAFFNGMGGAAGGGGRRTGPMPGPDAEMVLRLTFREAVFGVARQVEVETPVHCDTCEGTGARPGTSAVRCPECQGAGELRRVRQSILGQVITAVPCPRCQGTGQFIENPVRRLRRRGTAERAPHPDRRHPGRGGRGLDPAPGRPRPGRLPGWSQRGPLRPPVGAARRGLRAVGGGPPRLGARADDPGRPRGEHRLRHPGRRPGPGHRRRDPDRARSSP